MRRGWPLNQARSRTKTKTIGRLTPICTRAASVRSKAYSLWTGRWAARHRGALGLALLPDGPREAGGTGRFVHRQSHSWDDFRWEDAACWEEVAALEERAAAAAAASVDEEEATASAADSSSTVSRREILNTPSTGDVVAQLMTLKQAILAAGVSPAELRLLACFDN